MRLCALLILCASATDPACHRERGSDECAWQTSQEAESTDSEGLSLFQRAAYLKLKASAASDDKAALKALSTAAEEKADLMENMVANDSETTMLRNITNASNQSKVLNTTGAREKLDHNLAAAVNYVIQKGRFFGRAPTSPVQGASALARLLAAPVQLTTRMGLPWECAIGVILIEVFTLLFIMYLIVQSMRRRK